MFSGHWSDTAPIFLLPSKMYCQRTNTPTKSPENMQTQTNRHTKCPCDCHVLFTICKIFFFSFFFHEEETYATFDNQQLSQQTNLHQDLCVEDQTSELGWLCLRLLNTVNAVLVLHCTGKWTSSREDRTTRRHCTDRIVSSVPSDISVHTNRNK